MSYSNSLNGISADHLRGGFFVGWPNPPKPEAHLRVLQGSAHIVLALDGENVVGYITAISDGVLAAYIPHLEVLPAYKGQGIGTELMRRMFDLLQHIYMIDLICDPDVQPFYDRVGMTRYTGMIKRNHDRQSGE
ncbi:MAG: GNAT family N-acetyltransferase [Chloroflexota bacterium]